MSYSYEPAIQLAKRYLQARREFLLEANKIPELSGNDNFVGRIGELIALRYLQKQNRSVIKVTNKINKGFDLTCTEGSSISVKLITAENKSGRTTKLKQPWTELILISLNPHYSVDRIGQITYDNFQIAQNDGFITQQAFADKRYLKDGPLFDKYGSLHKAFDLLFF